MSTDLSLDDISTILEMLEERDVREFKLEREGETLSLKRGPQAGEAIAATQHVLASMPSPQVAAPVAQTAQAPAVAVVESPVVEEKNNYSEISSPMVGTFYRRPAADADPYVSVGDTVKKGDVLCIVEAMKIMNEIESDVSGKVVEVCLEDSQMVEYGEVIFRIDPLG